jgi:hypothetical protein
MLFQPAIIALLLASALCVLALAASAPFALDVIRRWDIRSGSERQLQLERRTYLCFDAADFRPCAAARRRAAVRLQR